MKISDYSKEALETRGRLEEENRQKNQDVSSFAFNADWEEDYIFLGISEKAGEIQRIYKYAIRAGLSPETYKDQAVTALGNLLWYLNAACDVFGTNLEEVARSNLRYIKDRWKSLDFVRHYDWPVESERFSSSYEFVMYNDIEKEGEKDVKKLKVDIISIDGKVLDDPIQFGDVIDDNEYDEDNYRFHDILHFAFLAYLGWSPVMRKLLRNKRKSNPEIDRVEDGAKSRDLEEALSLLIWRYMEQHKLLDENVEVLYVDSSFIRTIKEITKGREVSQVSEYMWEICILEAARAVREAIKLSRAGHDKIYVKAVLRDEHQEASLIVSDTSESAS